MIFLVRLDEAGAGGREIGGKARSLLRLAAAGLPVPPAVVVTAELFRALRNAGGGGGDGDDVARAPWPAGLEAALAAEVARLGGAAGAGARFAARSSAAIEDRAGALAPGIFLSRVDVPAAGVPAAVREVLASALAPAATAYAARFGLAARDLDMAVLVHPFVRGDAAGTAAFDPDAMAAPLVEATAGAAALAAAPRARAAIEEAARALAAAGEAVELEWVSTGGAVRFLQARPYRAARVAPGAAAQAEAWRWDAAHNPLPLSPAQAGLVAFVDERCRTAFRQQVRDGYLFYRRAGVEADLAPWPAGRLGDTLRAIAAATDARLARAPATLEEVLEIFAAAYEPLYGVVQPRAAAARAALAAKVRAEGGGPRELAALLAGVASAASARAALAAAIARAPDAPARAAAVAAYVDRFGDEAPVWDVAVPTYREDPSAIERIAAGMARASTSAAAAAAAAAGAAGDPVVEAAREGAAVAEDDDALYARAQAAVRRALLAEGARLAARGILAAAADVFWLPLAATRALASGATALDPTAATAAAAAVAEARATHARQLGSPPLLAPALTDGGAHAPLHGLAASPGRVVGRVRLHHRAASDAASDAAPDVLGAASGEPTVLVARTLLPTELPLIDAAALVVETGGLLDHVATQARERNIPAVVGVTGACAALREGDRVLVDGDAGLVSAV